MKDSRDLLPRTVLTLVMKTSLQEALESISTEFTPLVTLIGQPQDSV